MTRPKPLFTTFLLTIAACGIAPVFGGSTCESLTSLKLKNTAITMAETVAAGAFTSPLPAAKGKQPQSFRNLPAFCRVAATLTPVADSEIKIEVWLPETGWNGNLSLPGLTLPNWVVVIGAIAIAVLFSILPALRASRIDPIDAHTG